MENIVAAEYELEHLLLEGHCFDVSSGQPPRGLQFTLGTASEPVIVDTIVMANLVSFQPKQSWNLLEEGRYIPSFHSLTCLIPLFSAGLLPAEGEPRGLGPEDEEGPLR